MLIGSISQIFWGIFSDKIPFKTLYSCSLLCYAFIASFFIILAESKITLSIAYVGI